MIYGYCRVSTNKQEDNTSLEKQEEEILAEYPTAQIIKEVYSGAKERPLFTELIKRVKMGDKLVVTKLDRFCRTTKEGLEYLDELRQRGVAVHILNMGVIDNTPIGKMLTTCLLAFAEFEREQIIERCQGGKARKKEIDPNFKDGRPVEKVDMKKFNDLQERVRNKEITNTKAIELMGISRSKYYKLVATGQR